MNAWIIVGMLATIAIVAHLKPSWFKSVWETTVAWLAVAAAGAIPLFWDLALYLATDITWTELVSDSYRPLALVIAGALGVAIRHMNVRKKR